MDNFELSEELADLREISRDYEQQLRLAGININSMPEDIQLMLRKHYELKFNLQLHEINLSSLHELYSTLLRYKIDSVSMLNSVQVDILQLQQQIANEKEHLKNYETFVDSTLKGGIEQESNIDVKLKYLMEKMALFPVDDANIDGIISKVEKLQMKDTNENK